MPRRFAPLAPHLPAVLLLLFAGGSGTLAAGARGVWAVAGHMALLAFVAAYGQTWPDPLGLGRRGNLLLVAFAVALGASWLASPVPRAGRLGLLLLPAFLLVPSAVARCWSSAEGRRLGTRSLSVAVVAVAGGSLLAWWRLETPGASLPLGHHNLLAAWLLALLPLAALPWRDGGLGRWLAGLAGALGLAALVATRSLGAAVAVVAVAAAWALRWRKAWLAILAAALLLAPQLPRLAGILGGADTSARARWAYLEAGWHGLAARPMLGWGPGSARWTASEHLRPVPGVLPADQVVGDLHCLPLELAYELGWSGLLLAAGLALVFLARRCCADAEDPALRGASLAGLAALALMSGFGLPLAIAALPLAAAVGLAAALAAEAPTARRGGRAGAVLLAAVLAVCIAPLDLAHLAYGRAVGAADGDERLRHLRRAVELDPAFPLYRARLAWLEAEARPGDAEAARRARAAAADARGVAALWLVAGGLGQEAGEPWRRDALLEACRLSPLGAIAPFRLALDAGAPPSLRAQWAGRALLAEPLLLAAVAWQGDLVVDAAIDELWLLEDVDSDWLRALDDAARTLGPTAGPTRRLVLEMDGDPTVSASLYAFRRRPWPAYLAEVDLWSKGLAAIDLGAATGLATTDAEVFRQPLCGLGGS